MKNKAVYAAALVADGWAGAENLEKWLCNRRTEGRTDGPKSGLESRVRDWKKKKKQMIDEKNLDPSAVKGNFHPQMDETDQ